jgi:hypothetical protein
MSEQRRLGAESQDAVEDAPVEVAIEQSAA